MKSLLYRFAQGAQMQRKIVLAIASVLATGAFLAAQQSPPPDIITSQTAAAVALTSYKSWVEGQITGLWTTTGQDEANISALQTQINSLQTQLTSQGQLIQQLQQTVATLSTPQPASTTATFSTLPDGPLNGIGPGGINFGTGFWCVQTGELKPCADGQPQRAWTFPRAVTITNVTFSSVTATTTGVVFTNVATGQKLQATAAGVNADTGVSLNFSVPVTNITIGALPSTGSAPDLRFRSITYQ